MRRTKIVASLGPASWDEPVLRKMIAAGADVIRINLSHGDPATQLALIDRVRQVIAPCAVGGLRPELGPGTFVIPDQLIDRTSGRTQTYYDEGAVHVSFADP